MPPILVAVALVVSQQTAPAASAAPELTADQIVDKALARGGVTMRQGTATLQMTIEGAKGDVKQRTLEIKAMKGPDGLTKSLVRFSKPADVAGISFLVIEKKDALPDQYVYVPAAKVVRRVAAGNAGSSFFGSDFAFADLMPLPTSERDKVSFARLPDADVGGQPVHVIEATPLVEGAPYGKLISYVHREHLIPVQIDFFDGKKQPLKTMKVKKLKKVKGDLIPVELTMKNLQAGTKTTLIIEDPNPDAVLGDADFTEEAMQR
jgi:hypothetical protein